MKTLKSFSTYTLISIVTAGIPFLLMPVLTHYLTTEDYGELSLFNTYVTILIPLISLGTTGVFSVEYFKKSKKGFQEIFSSTLWIPFVLTSFFIVITILFTDTIANLIEIPPKLLFAIPIISLIVIVSDVLYGQLIMQKKAKTYGVIAILKTIVEVSLSLFFIVILAMNWEGRILSQGIAAFLTFLFSIYYFHKKEWLNIKVFSSKRIKQSLLFGLPLVPHLIGKFVINQSDTIFIAKMISVEDAGIYRIGYQFGFIISIVSGAFLSVYTPFLYERLARITEQKKIEIIKLSYFFILGLILLTLLLTVSSDFIFSNLIHHDFKSGAQFVFWTSLSYVFWGGYLIFAGYIFYLKKTKILAYISILNIFLNLVLNYYFIKLFGVIGVSYATACSFFITFVIVVFISNKLYPMPWISFLKNNNETN